MSCREYRVAVYVVSSICVDVIIFFVVLFMLSFELLLHLPAHGHVRESQSDTAYRIETLFVKHDRGEVKLADGVDPVHLPMVFEHIILWDVNILAHRQRQVRSLLAHDVAVLRQ